MSHPKIEDISPERLLINLDDFTFDKSNEGFMKSTSLQVFKKTKKNDPNQTQSLVNEYNQLVKCSHPCVQNVIGLYCQKDLNEYSLITPFQEKTLNDLIRSNLDISDSEKFIIVLGITMGMKYLHMNRILHGNLNPYHIFIDSNKEPIIFCFGKTTNQDISNNYKAPELYRNEEYEQASDIYSFGLIINELFSQNPMFSDVSEDEILNIKNNRTFEICNSMPTFLQTIVSDCLNPVKNLRPTFKDILTALESKIYEINHFHEINYYYIKIQTRYKQKCTFKIPKQLIKLPNKDESNVNPVDFQAFDSIFNPKDGRKAILIMLFGQYESGKSLFIKTLTGNQAYSTKNRTKGILIDGPYKINEILAQSEHYLQIYEQLNKKIDDETQLFFIDSQGIEYEDCKELSFLFDKIYPIFCSISTVCIIPDNVNISKEQIQKMIKKIKMFPTSNSTQLFFLLRHFESFLNQRDYNFDIFLQTQNQLFEHFSSICKEYKNVHFLPVYEVYMYQPYIQSVFFSFLFILSQIKNEDLFLKSTIRNGLNTLSKAFFSDIFIAFEKMIEMNEMRLDRINRENNSLMNPFSAYYYFLMKIMVNLMLPKNRTVGTEPDVAASYFAQRVLSSFQIYENRMEMDNYINILTNFGLPFKLREFKLPLHSIAQYSEMLARDINSILKSKEIKTIKCLKYTEITNEIFDKMTSDFGGSINLKTNSDTSISLQNQISSILPFHWDFQTHNFISTNYDTNFCRRIGGDSEQLIIFFEQDNPSNDSTLLFRALTGFDVNFEKEKKVSKLFKNVPIQRMLTRIKRLRKKNYVSKLLNPPVKKVNILYLKGCPQCIFRRICKAQNRKPICVSSMIEGQEITIGPPPDCVFNMFILSEHSYKYQTVSLIKYVQNINDAKSIILKKNPQLSNVNLLPVNSTNYCFNFDGPVVHELIRYGCRFILQDQSFDKYS